jgi:hypothetical protein
MLAFVASTAGACVSLADPPELRCLKLGTCPSDGGEEDAEEMIDRSRGPSPMPRSPDGPEPDEIDAPPAPDAALPDARAAADARAPDAPPDAAPVEPDAPADAAADLEEDVTVPPILPDAPAPGDAAEDAADAGGPGADAPSPDAPPPDAAPDAPVDAPPPPPPDAPELRRNGLPCTVGQQCQSGLCADGVCCDVGCAGLCEACNLPGWVGTCTAVPNGEDPGNECDVDPPDTCRRDGVCDGMRKCRLRAAGAPCGVQECRGSTEYSSRTCDGLGDCRPATTKPCDPYVCGAGNACATSCTSNAQCLASSFCDTARMRCMGLQPAGGSCTAGNECVSGQCVDGVCCQSTCTAPCHRCNLPGALGTCTPINAGEDPDNECAQEAASSCGLDGFCDGRGACRKWGAGTVCVMASCTGTMEVSAATCDGAGVCSTPMMRSCAPLVCGANSQCLSTCTMDPDCTTGYFCDTGGACGTKRANGTACMRGGECTSGNCVSGLCCDSPCTGTCMTCASGICSPLAAGAAAPAGQCPAEDASTCGRNGNCNGQGACQLHQSGTVCVTATCASNSQTTAGTCNGTGTCQAGTMSSCNGHTCNGTACGTDCMGSSANCLTGYFCDVNQCKPK